MRTATLLLLSATAVAVHALAPTAPAAGIEAVRGKRYTITKQHGPWMIMVASFKAPPKELQTEGMSPQEAADELVWELRRKGIPAYTIGTSEEFGEIAASDRLTAFAAAQAGLDSAPTESRSYVARRENICVLAGNYDDPKGDVAQKTLEYIKSFHPEFLKDEDPNVSRNNSPLVKLRNGGIWRKTPGQPSPLAGAFLTTNPLLNPEEVKRRQRDPLLLKLNGDSEYSLHNNPGKYSVIVATFRGDKALIHGTGDTESEKIQLLDARAGQRLDDAAMNAWQLCKKLRAGAGGRPPMEAWVWHDRTQSIVTVGSFKDPNDPRIAEIQKIFGAKVVTSEKTGYRPVLIGEPMVLNEGEGDMINYWIFDPKPQVVAVPTLR